MVGIKALVIGMGLLLVAGFVVIAVTLVGRVGSAEDDAAPFLAKVALAPGERLVDAEIDGKRVLFRIDGASGARVEVRDLARGELLGQFEFDSQTK